MARLQKGGLSRSMASNAPTNSSRVSLLGHRPFVLYVGARTCTELASQMSVVAIGWHVYALTGSAFNLGMIGLIQFLPMAVLVFVAGHAADRYTRQHVVLVCQIIECLAAAFLAWGALSGWLTVPQIFAAVAVLGVAAAFESPAEAALLPTVAPHGMLQRATAIATGAFQVAMISGPALGGITYAIAPWLPFALMAGFWLLAATLNGAIKVRGSESAKEPPTLETLFAGVKFVRSNPAILGTISLDLFAVLLGGATALLPIYARDILHTGPWGLGVLRAAPAAGALLMTAYLARHPIDRRVGMRMFQAVIFFGAATVVFALSKSVWLSLAALGLAGAADTISVVIRISLVQLATPDAMRGRVGAVNYLFINASNQLGEFESGMAAALIGAMPAAVLGGIGTIVVALLWMRLFPTLRDVERLE
jgi:MFS family permease